MKNSFSNIILFALTLLFTLNFASGGDFINMDDAKFFYQYKDSTQMDAREFKKYEALLSSSNLWKNYPVKVQEDIKDNGAIGYYVPMIGDRRPNKKQLKNLLISVNPQTGNFAYKKQNGSVVYSFFKITEYTLSGSIEPADGQRNGRSLYPYLPGFREDFNEQERDVLDGIQKKYGIITESSARLIMPSLNKIESNELFCKLIDMDRVICCTSKDPLNLGNYYVPSYRDVLINVMVRPWDNVYSYNGVCEVELVRNNGRNDGSKMLLAQCFYYDKELTESEQLALVRTISNYLQSHVRHKLNNLDWLYRDMDRMLKMIQPNEVKTDGNGGANTLASNQGFVASPLVQQQMSYWQNCLNIYNNTISSKLKNADFQRFYLEMSDDGIYEVELPKPQLPKGWKRK